MLVYMRNQKPVMAGAVRDPGNPFFGVLMHILFVPDAGLRPEMQLLELSAGLASAMGLLHRQKLPLATHSTARA